MRNHRGAIRTIASSSTTSADKSTRLTDGTAIGSMTAGGGLAAAFDGNFSQVQTACAKTAPSVSGYNNTVGKNWGVATRLDTVIVCSPTDASLLGTLATTFNVDGSDDGTNWTTIASAVASPSTFGITVISDMTSTTKYKYHRIAISGNGTNTAAVAEVIFYGAR